MTPAQLARAVRRTVRGAVESGELRVAVPERVPLRRPPHGGGDWAPAVALRLAGPAGRPAPEVARVLGDRLARVPGVAEVEVRGGGFLAITLADGADAGLLREILERTPADTLADAPAENPARDAARWAEVAGGDPTALLLVQREENPLFRVRHAHARSRALTRWGSELGVWPEPRAVRFTHPAERALLGLLGDDVLGGEGVPVGRRCARGLLAVADAFRDAEQARPVLPSGDEKPQPVHGARLALAQAAGVVLADGLARLGISAPDRV